MTASRAPTLWPGWEFTVQGDGPEIRFCPDKHSGADEHGSNMLKHLFSYVEVRQTKGKKAYEMRTVTWWRCALSKRGVRSDGISSKYFLAS